MQSAMRWTVMDDLMVCVTSSGAPDPEAMASFIEELRTKPIRRILSTPWDQTEGLDAEQQACSEICQSKNIRVALLVEASLASMYAFLATLGGSSVGTFTWDETDAAFAHLDVQGPAVAQVRATLMSMRRSQRAVAA